MTILIQRAAYVVRAADRVEQDCDVLIEGSLIAGVGHYDPQPDWDVIEAAGCAVIPGLVNAHTHLYQNFLKGLNDGVSLIEWIARVLYPAADVIHAYHWDAQDERMGYAWSLVAALEMKVRHDLLYQHGHDYGWSVPGLAGHWLSRRGSRDPR